MDTEDPGGETPKVDIYRDTSLRYLGYANEVGESFRALIGSTWVLASYVLATAYVLADTTDKTITTYKTKESAPNRHMLTVTTAADTLIWQMCASVIIPGFVINRTCFTSNYLLKKAKILPEKPRKLLVTCIGLSTIPFIIHPIDKFVDISMDNTFRKMGPNS